MISNWSSEGLNVVMGNVILANQRMTDDTKIKTHRKLDPTTLSVNSLVLADEINKDKDQEKQQALKSLEDNIG